MDHEFVEERCEPDDFARWAAFISAPEYSPEATEQITGVPAPDLRAAARLYASAGNAAIYYGLGVTEHSQGSTMVMGMANLAMATGNIGREGVGVNPLRGQNNVQGSCDMGSFPHEFSGYRHVSDTTVRHLFEELWGRPLDSETRAAHPEHVRRRHRGDVQGPLRPGRGHRAVRSEYPSRPGGAGVARAVHRAGPVPERDLQVRTRVLARDVVSRKGRDVHQRRAAHQPGEAGHGPEERQAGVAGGLRARHGDGLPDELRAAPARSWTR